MFPRPLAHRCVRPQVGLVGLVEGEWLETLGAVDTDTMAYKDFVAKGRRLGRQLRVRAVPTPSLPSPCLRPALSVPSPHHLVLVDCWPPPCGQPAH